MAVLLFLCFFFLLGNESRGRIVLTKERRVVYWSSRNWIGLRGRHLSIVVWSWKVDAILRSSVWGIAICLTCRSNWCNEVSSSGRRGWSVTDILPLICGAGIWHIHRPHLCIGSVLRERRVASWNRLRVPRVRERGRHLCHRLLQVRLTSCRELRVIGWSVLLGKWILVRYRHLRMRDKACIEICASRQASVSGFRARQQRRIGCWRGGGSCTSFIFSCSVQFLLHFLAWQN